MKNSEETLLQELEEARLREEKLLRELKEANTTIEFLETEREVEKTIAKKDQETQTDPDEKQTALEILDATLRAIDDTTKILEEDLARKESKLKPTGANPLLTKETIHSV